MTRNVRAMLRAGTVGAAGSMFALTVSLSGQAPAAPAAQTAKPAGAPAATAKPYVPPRTPWGEPDIQGMFNFSYVGSVGLERCGGGGTGRAPADYIAKVTGRTGGGPGGPGAAGGGRAGAGRVGGVAVPGAAPG